MTHFAVMGAAPSDRRASARRPVPYHLVGRAELRCVRKRSVRQPVKSARQSLVARIRTSRSVAVRRPPSDPHRRRSIVIGNVCPRYTSRRSRARRRSTSLGSSGRAHVASRGRPHHRRERLCADLHRLPVLETLLPVCRYAISVATFCAHRAASAPRCSRSSMGDQPRFISRPAAKSFVPSTIPILPLRNV